MKKTTLLMSILVVLLWSAIGNAAEYKADNGEGIDIIAQKTGYFKEHLAELNGISGPKYIVPKNKALRYVSDDDFANAQKWIENHLEGLHPEHVDYDPFVRLYEAIVIRTVNHSGDLSPHADEVILFAGLHKTQKTVRE